MSDISCPRLAAFDRRDVPNAAYHLLLSYEQRHVLEDMCKALKKARSCVFRCGSYIMTDGDIVSLTMVPEDIFSRVLPRLLLLGFMARDDEGALYSPQMYQALLRREERAARRAQAERDWQQAVAAGEVPPGMTRRQMTARENGLRGGRCRKGETLAERDARRQRELEAAKAQRNMPLMGVLAGGKTETENPSKKPNGFSVSASSVSVGSIDLELERNILSSTACRQLSSESVA